MRKRRYIEPNFHICTIYMVASVATGTRGVRGVFSLPRVQSVASVPRTGRDDLITTR